MEQVNPLDWQVLAHKWANNYRTHGEHSDLFQQAMLGVCKAASSFNGEGNFYTWATIKIRQAMQALIYSDPKTRAKRHRLECPLVVPSDDDENTKSNDLLARDYYEQEELYVSEFIEQLPVEHREKEFFIEILEHGSTVAGKRYMERTGMTRQGMGLQRKKVLSIAEKMYANV